MTWPSRSRRIWERRVEMIWAWIDASGEGEGERMMVLRKSVRPAV
jgi:hypothetical protein